MVRTCQKLVAKVALDKITFYAMKTCEPEQACSYLSHYRNLLGWLDASNHALELIYPPITWEPAFLHDHA